MQALLPTFADYQSYAARFVIDRTQAQACIDACAPLVIEALSVYGAQHFWRGDLPVYAVMTTPADNGGWGHVMPVWFKPYERPVPLYILERWGLFALFYARSFGVTDEARRLAERFVTAETLMRVVVGANVQLPFLPSTQGRGTFFRHGMLPYLLSILWLEDEARHAWLRLHALGAEHYIAHCDLAHADDPVARLDVLEFAVFNDLERNTITTDAAVAAFLAGEPSQPDRSPLVSVYREMFGALNLGVAALAAHYARKGYDAWRVWAPQEIGVAYRMSDYGGGAILSLLRR